MCCGATVFTAASFSITVSFPSRNRCRPSPCAGLSPARVLRRLRPTPDPIGGRCAQPKPAGWLPQGSAGPGWFPVFTVIRSTDEGPTLPCGITTVTRSTSPWSPGRPTYPAQEFPLDLSGCAPPGPYPPDLSRCKMKGRKRRFLAYSFPPRSPDPHHLAVLARPGFVRAASLPPGTTRVRAALSFTVLLRRDQRRRSFTSVQINSASRRTGRSLRSTSRVPAGQVDRLTRVVASATHAPSRNSPLESMADTSRGRG